MSEQSSKIPEQARNYIGGEWVIATGSQEKIVDPAVDTVIAGMRFTTEEGVDAAVSSATTAFSEWSETPVVERVQYLFDLKTELESMEDEIASTLSAEHGKTVAEAKGELKRGIENVEVAAGMPSLLRSTSGTVESVSAGIDEFAIRKPLGVYTAITPFNFPAMIPLWFLPYAVATGNTFILKPSEKVPLTAQLLFDAIDRIGLPPGVANLCNGGAATVDALLTHPDIEGVSFVGSTPVAQHVYKTAASTGKRVQAQGGAKNFAVVTPSAKLDKVVPNLIGSVFGNAGQRCLANDIVIAVDSVADRLESKLIEAVATLQIGRGSDPTIDVGPLITKESRDRVEMLVSDAVKEGAEILVDGRDVRPDDLAGHFMGPTLIKNVTTSMDIFNQEIFGPVGCLMDAEDLHEAIDLVNSSEFGNASTLYTNSGDAARQYRNRVEAGNIGINVGVCAPMGFFHFGGRKGSFFGDLHAQGTDAVQFYTDKTILIERWL